MQRASNVSADRSYGASAQRAGDTAEGYWAYFLGAAEALGGRLARLVDFRHGRLEVKPILPASEDYYLRQNLILKLQLAQLGLVSGDQPVYQRSLTLAMTWLSDGFDAESPLAQSLLATLGDYAAMRIDQPLPDISASLQLARQALRQAERAAGRGAQAQAGRGAATQAGRRAQARGLAERAAEGQQTQ